MKINLKKIKSNKKYANIMKLPVFDSAGNIVSFKSVDINDDGVVCFYLNDTDVFDISNGDTVTIERYKQEELICEQSAKVINVIGRYLFLKFPLDNTGNEIVSVSDFVENGNHYYKVILGKNHNVIKSDIDYLTSPKVTINCPNKQISGYTGDFFVEESENYNSNVVYVNISSLYEPEAGGTLDFNFNPFMYNNGDEWLMFSDVDEESSIKISYGNQYINLNIGMSSNTDYVGLRQNELVEDYYEKIVSTIVPDTINMERVKYVPFLGESGLQATGIDFYLHFRTRDTDTYTNDNGVEVNMLTPSESWSIKKIDYVDELSSGKYGEVSKNYWNQVDDYYDIVGDDIYKSDLVGKLGFTDDDILNTKNKVKKSFLRISFYNSNNPLQTSMLYSSTIFIDSNSLYKKAVLLKNNKQYDSWKETFNNVDDNGYDNGWGVTLFDGKDENGDYYDGITSDSIITCDIKTSIEQSDESSSEGYNLYLFSDDSPSENEYRTIYMKIEFNHAGYGRVIPMLMWPKDESGNPVGLTKDNYFSSLYIPVKVYVDKTTGKFAYSIEGAKNDEETGKIKIAIFEPKLEASYS